MWGRRTSRDSDVAAIARRRLEAIAAEFDRPPVPDHGSPSASPTNPKPPRQAVPPVGSGQEGGRHRVAIPARNEGRWRLTVHHVALVALLLAVLLAVAAWWALRSVSHGEPVPLASRSSRTLTDTSLPLPGPGVPPDSTPAGGTPVTTQVAAPVSSPGSAGGQLVVDVAGRVRHPGIVELPAGSRVVDALEAAGGPKAGVRTAQLNLARPLVDGEQVVVGLNVPLVGAVTTSPSAGATPSEPAPASVDINTATEPELETLPGIGPVTAQSILDWRSQNGSFASVDQLLDVSGIGEATLADLKPYVHV